MKKIASNSKPKKSIILLSGGMDSLLLMARAHQRGDDIYALHCNYGQHTQRKEKFCFKKICQHYRVATDHQKYLNLPFLKLIGGSSLTDTTVTLSTSGINLQNNATSKKHPLPTSYVPFRNSIMLSIAVSWAEVLKADHILIGAVHEDATGYPDCRPAYFKVFNQLIKVGGNAKKLFVETPIIHMSKKEILEQCFELKAPLQYTWSCYKEQDLACGVCDSCRLRLKAFKLMKKKDPIKYANKR